MMEEFYISSLFVENYRNLKSTYLDFSPSVNFIYGHNGNGKTNLLEIIYYLAQRKSFRKNVDFSQLVNFDNELSHFTFSSKIVDKQNNYYTLSGKKGIEKAGLWSIDGKIVKSYDKLPVVYVDPFLVQSFFNIPQSRRKWLDDHLSILSKNYSSYLRRYQECVRQRNKLLAYPHTKYLQGQLKAINEQLCINAEVIYEERNRFIKNINPLITPVYKNLFDEEPQLEVFIESKEYSNVNRLKVNLETCLNEDLARKTTTHGPHRDIFGINLNGLNITNYGSLGQQKCSFFVLLFSFIELFSNSCGTYPLLLLDDVSGELDEVRWERILKLLFEGKYQVFITSANFYFKKALEYKENSRNNKNFLIKDGVVKESSLWNTGQDSNEAKKVLN